MWRTMHGGACLLAAILACTLGSASAVAQPAAREHPYLFFTKQDVPALRERLKHPRIARIFESVRATALRPNGDTRQDNNILSAGVAYNLTGDRACAEPALRIIGQLAAEKDSWGASANGLKYCDLGTAIKTLPLTYGYDLLYDTMSEQEREAVRQALRTKVFPNYLKALAIHDREKRQFTDPQGHREWWTNCYFNWNAWVNGDIGLAALATLDEIPESRQVLEKARESLRYMHPELAQGDVEDGGCDEGVMYWQVIGHAIHFYAALERVMGTDDGFFELPGVKRTMQFGLDFVAPDGHWANFSDCPDRVVLDPPGELYLLASRSGNPQYLRYMDDYAAPWHSMPFGVLWRPLIDTPLPEARPRARLYRDINWAVLTAGTLYVPFKAGDLGANHGQWDDNNLLLWVKGERMLNDPGYGKRETADHNCLLVDGQGQQRGQGTRHFGGHTTSVATILSCGTVGEDSYLVSEAASCYGNALERYQRHVVVAPEGYAIVFDDVVAARAARAGRPAQFTVNWHTLHSMQLASPDVALIRGKSERLAIAVAADSPLESSVQRASFDTAFRIQSPAGTRAWRLITVLASGDQPTLQVDFTDLAANVSVNGHRHVFEQTPAGYRYSGRSAMRTDTRGK